MPRAWYSDVHSTLSIVDQHRRISSLKIPFKPGIHEKIQVCRGKQWLARPLLTERHWELKPGWRSMKVVRPFCCSPVLVTTAEAPPLAWMSCVPQKSVCLRWLSELYRQSPVGSGVFSTGTLSPGRNNVEDKRVGTTPTDGYLRRFTFWLNTSLPCLNPSFLPSCRSTKKCFFYEAWTHNHKACRSNLTTQYVLCTSKHLYTTTGVQLVVVL